MVGLRAAIQGVIALHAAERIGAKIAGERIVARLSRQRIVCRVAAQHPGLGRGDAVAGEFRGQRPPALPRPAEAEAGNRLLGQAAALVCALMMAGVAGSAICTDLGSRKIREEIDAMEVMGIDVIERLVAPRLVAAVIVSLALCSMVTFGGVIACYLYHIYVQHLPAGTFMATFSQYGRSSDFVMALVKAAVFGIASTLVATFKGLHAKGGPRGVADAVNEAVVIAFALVFIVNTVLSALYTVIVPAVGEF